MELQGDRVSGAASITRTTAWISGPGDTGQHMCSGALTCAPRTSLGTAHFLQHQSIDPHEVQYGEQGLECGSSY